MVSTIPFEQRYPPPNPKRRKREPLTAVDRFVGAFLGGVLGFVSWTFSYSILLIIALKAAAKQPAGAVGGLAINPLDKLPSFSWGGLVVAGFATFSAIVGAERMMDAFEKVVHFLGKIAEHAIRHQD